MKLKTIEIEEKTYAEIQDGKPVYVNDDGKETAFDAPGTVQTIARLNAEAKGHRERAEAAEKGLKAFEGIDDPDAARKAVETVTNLDHKKLVDAGEVEKVKAEAIKAVEEKYKPVIEERDGLQKLLRQEKIGGSFARSKYIAEKLAVPAPMVEKTFGEYFAIEDGKVIAKDANGTQLYSKSRPGEAADFDEAIEQLVDQFPYKDAILKANTAEGGEVKNTGSSGNGSARQIKRGEFEKMDPNAQRRAVVDDKAVIVD